VGAITIIGLAFWTESGAPDKRFVTSVPVEKPVVLKENTPVPVTAPKVVLRSPAFRVPYQPRSIEIPRQTEVVSPSPVEPRIVDRVPVAPPAPEGSGGLSPAESARRVTTSLDRGIVPHNLLTPTVAARRGIRLTSPVDPITGLRVIYDPVRRRTMLGTDHQAAIYEMWFRSYPR
jgi:hypothetical protein